MGEPLPPSCDVPEAQGTTDLGTISPVAPGIAQPLYTPSMLPPKGPGGSWAISSQLTVSLVRDWGLFLSGVSF